jgi:hypothetical protein
MLAKISKTDAQWLLNTFAPIRGGRVDNSTFQMFLKAYNLMKGTDRKINCFSCEGRTIAAMANNMFEQYESEIQSLASATRGRKAKK